MKQKRYFYDWMNSNSLTAKEKIILALIFILSFVLSFIVGKISYNVITLNNKDSFNSYSSSTYDYLEEIANTVIKEGSSFDLVSIPEDVSSYKITYQDNEIKFVYYLNNNENLKYIPSSYMIVTLSEDFQILDTTANYTSEEEYIEQIRTSMRIDAFFIGVFTCIFILLTILVSIVIATIVSFFHKKREQKYLIYNPYKKD